MLRPNDFFKSLLLLLRCPADPPLTRDRNVQLFLDHNETLLFFRGTHELLLQGLALVLVDHGQHASNTLAHGLDLGQLVGGSTGNLGDAQGLELGLQLLELQ